MYTHCGTIACGAFWRVVFAALAVDIFERGFFLSPASKRFPGFFSILPGDLALAEDEDLGIPKSTVAFGTPLVRHKNEIAIRHEVDELETLCPLAVGPATFEIRHPVDVIIQWTREVEVIGD